MNDYETFEEWRVTGQPGPASGFKFPPYDFTWSLERGPADGRGDPEAAARAFVAATSDGRWTEGPTLHRRTVVRSPWQEV